jgi:hypothetical protein
LCIVKVLSIFIIDTLCADQRFFAVLGYFAGEEENKKAPSKGGMGARSQTEGVAPTQKKDAIALHEHIYRMGATWCPYRGTSGFRPPLRVGGVAYRCALRAPDPRMGIAAPSAKKGREQAKKAKPFLRRE